MIRLKKSIFHNVKKGFKSIEPVVMLFSGAYLLVHGMQGKNYPLGIAGGLLLFRGGVNLGKVIEESDLEEVIMAEKK
ncbi:hypothetical protein [Cecembia rubra]|uniref:Uncharacterized protein n=1 Tax=Cecembia rubra TaxID=1485585 RepID=A0A2P8DYH5_9BACT|nr:hypothetical protein [Cecembia rubra]PSL02274.1 hypothetical protein CLV48_11057 [Cecembia rubra]